MTEAGHAGVRGLVSSVAEAGSVRSHDIRRAGGTPTGPEVAAPQEAQMLAETYRRQLFSSGAVINPALSDLERLRYAVRR